VRTCVIFNPAAQGEKARRFRRHLDAIGRESSLKQTAGAGDARRLAAEAVAEGFEDKHPLPEGPNRRSSGASRKRV